PRRAAGARPRAGRPRRRAGSRPRAARGRTLRRHPRRRPAGARRLRRAPSGRRDRRVRLRRALGPDEPAGGAPRAAAPRRRADGGGRADRCRPGGAPEIRHLRRGQLSRRARLLRGSAVNGSAGDDLRVLAWAPGDNPYFRILRAELAAAGIRVADHSLLRCLFGRYDLWHVQFPERGVAGGRLEARARALAFLVMVLRCRLGGRRIVWTVHNLRSHEGRHPGLERRMLGFFAARVDLAVSLTETGRRLALAAWPGLAGAAQRVIPHPHYRSWYRNRVTRRAARTALGLPETARVVLLVGKMRPYKDPVGTVRTFRRLEDPGARLVLAGEPTSPEMRRDIEAAAEGDPRILLRLEEFPDAAAELYMNAADLVALPYLDILNSGSAIWALSFARPILLPERGAMAELEALVGPDWVRLFSGELDAETLDRALAWAQ